MESIVQELLSSVALLVLCSFLIGFVFDRTQPGITRDALVGFVGGASSFIIMAFAHHTGGFVVDARTPVLMVTAFFSGPLGALVAAPLPIVMRFEAGGAYAPAGVIGILVALAAGAMLRMVLDARVSEISRYSVLILAGISPLTLLGLWLSPGPLTFAEYAPVVLPLLAWSPIATFALGSLVLNEWTRARVRHEEALHREFLREADHVSREFLEAKLSQDFRLHERYGAQFGYMIVAIDEGANLYGSLAGKQWHALRSAVAKALRQTVRECDVCAPVDEDRFGVIIPYVGQEALVDVAERIQSAVQSTTEDAGHAATVSIGIAHVHEANSARDLEVIAEQALVLAKTVQPTNAIGPQVPQQGANGPVVRSFPGALVSPAALPGTTVEPPPEPPPEPMSLEDLLESVGSGNQAQAAAKPTRSTAA